MQHEQFGLQLPIHTERLLRDFVFRTFNVRISDHASQPGLQSPWRFFCDAYFQRHENMIALASRGFGGKTFLIALLALTLAITKRCDISIIGGSSAQARNCYQYILKWLLSGNGTNKYLADPPTQYSTKFIWGNTITVHTASQTSVRGPHPQILIADECDEIPQDIMDAALGMPMRKGEIAPLTLITSTRQNINGTMDAMLARARLHRWGQYEWTYRENLTSVGGWLPDEDVEKKKLTVPKVMWDAEYENQEPNPQGRAIAPQAIAAMFTDEMQLDGRTRWIGEPHEEIVLEPPVEGASYTHGIDWGRKEDWTIIVTIRVDVKPIELVAFERLGREPWDVMIAHANTRVNRYGGHAMHDATGIGDVVREQLGYKIEDFLFVGRERSKLISDYIAAVERQEIICPHIEWLENEHKFASADDCYGSGHLPDTIAAMALAYRAGSGAPAARFFG